MKKNTATVFAAGLCLASVVASAGPKPEDFRVGLTAFAAPDLGVTLPRRPKDEVADAYHIATAAVHGMDVLLTWNCRHMANRFALPKTISVVTAAGYACPAIVTPEDFLKEELE